MLRGLHLLALGLALALAAAGCGGDGNGTTAAETTNPAPATTAPATTGPEPGGGGPADGATVFADAGCGECHTFAAAGTTGTIGPSLDTSVLTVEQIEGQIRFPSGPMPSFEGQLSDAEIAAVARYVAENRTG